MQRAFSLPYPADGRLACEATWEEKAIELLPAGLQRLRSLLEKPDMRGGQEARGMQRQSLLM